MRTILSLLLLTALAGAQAVSGGKSTLGGNFISGSTVAAAGTNIGPADAFIDMNTSSPTTPLTTTILQNGTIGFANTNGYTLSASSGMTVGAHQSGCTLLGTPSVDGTSYATSHTSQSIDFDHANSLKTADLSIPLATGPVGYTQVTVTGCLVLGPASVAQGSAVLFDFIYLRISAGNYATMQLNNGNCGGAALYAVNIETNPSGVTTHSACSSALTPGSTIFYTFRYDSGAGSASLNLHNSSGVQIGTTITGTASVGVIDLTRIGNNESGTSAGNHSFFENTLIRYSGGSPFPMGPANTTQVPVYWAAQSHNSHASGTTTTLATTKALEEQIADEVNVVCSNENASGAATGVSNTAGETFTKNTGSETAANGQSINAWRTCVASNHVAQTYTCTWPASQFSNIDVQIIHGSASCPTFDVAAVGNKASGADSATAAYTPSTATGSNIACAYVQAGQAIAQDANGQMLRTSATDSMGCQFRANAPNASQITTGVHSNTAASMITVSNYKQ